jgi:hypothetical protein
MRLFKSIRVFVSRPRRARQKDPIYGAALRLRDRRAGR